MSPSRCKLLIQMHHRVLLLMLMILLCPAVLAEEADGPVQVLKISDPSLKGASQRLTPLDVLDDSAVSEAPLPGESVDLKSSLIDVASDVAELQYLDEKPVDFSESDSVKLTAVMNEQNVMETVRLETGSESEAESLRSRASESELSGMTPVDWDIQTRTIPVRAPYHSIQLKFLDFLPSKLFFYGSTDLSTRLETNPYQAPPAYREPFVENTQAFRMQNNLTIGYALTPKDKIQLSFLRLVNKYDNFTRYRLDGTFYSIAPSYQRTLLEKNGWQVTANIQARQTITNSGETSGGFLPSATIVKVFRNGGYSYVNGALDLGRSNFAIGDVDTLTPTFTVGYGWQMPYDSQRGLLRLLEGVGVSLSGSYSFNTVFNSDFPSPSNYQTYFLTAEVTKPIYKNAPINLFCRSENILNTGHDRNAFGVSGVNYRLFGGMRVSMSKPAVFVRKLPFDHPKEKGAAK